MKKWKGIEISENYVKDDIWSLIRCCDVRLCAFPLGSSSLKRLEYTGFRDNNIKKLFEVKERKHAGGIVIF